MAARRRKIPLAGAAPLCRLWADHSPRGTRGNLVCCASYPETASAGACAVRDALRWLGVAGRSWHVTPRPRAKGETPLVGAAPFYTLCADHNPRGTARARDKFVCCASSPRDSERRYTCVARDPRRWLGIGGRRWHVAPQPCAEGETPLAGLSLFGQAWPDHNPRGTAHGRRKLEFCVSSPETTSAVACPRVPRDS